MTIALLACILGLLALWFGLNVLTLAWRAADALAQGVVGGVVLFWKLVRWTVRAVWRGLDHSGRWLIDTDLAMSQRAHAAWWTWSYWLKRAYIASALRARRRERT